MTNPEAVVYICQPSYGGIEPEAMHSYIDGIRTSTKFGIRTITSRCTPTALLARNFNMHLCMALNDHNNYGITHFCMIHSDVQCMEENWLDILYQEMKRTKADVLSAVLPIKWSIGYGKADLTSTAILDTGRSRSSVIQIPLTETLRLAHDGDKPDFRGSFGVQELMKHYSITNDERLYLLVNTGLILVDIRHPGFRKIDTSNHSSIYFDIVDRIMPTGKMLNNQRMELHSQGMSEDWNFSVLCQDAKMNVMATHVVRAQHIGRMHYRNWESAGVQADTISIESTRTLKSFDNEINS